MCQRLTVHTRLFEEYWPFRETFFCRRMTCCRRRCGIDDGGRRQGKHYTNCPLIEINSDRNECECNDRDRRKLTLPSNRAGVVIRCGSKRRPLLCARISNARGNVFRAMSPACRIMHSCIVDRQRAMPLSASILRAQKRDSRGARLARVAQ